MKSKKGQVFNQLGALGIGIAALTITLVVVFLILSQGIAQIGEIEGTACNTTNSASLSCNSTYAMQSAVEDIPGWVPLIVIASIGAILLGLVAIFRR